MEVTQEMRDLVKSLNLYGHANFTDSTAIDRLKVLMAEPMAEPTDYSQLVIAEPYIYPQGAPEVVWQKNIRTNRWESLNYLGRGWHDLRHPRLYNPGEKVGK